jgi:hypothetical protein
VLKAIPPAETGALFVKALNAAVEAIEQQEYVSAETSVGEFSAETPPLRFRAAASRRSRRRLPSSAALKIVDAHTRDSHAADRSP